MGHHAPQAFPVAADAAVKVRRLAGKDLAGPVRVGDQLTAHGGAVNSPGPQLFLHKVRVGESPHAADGQIGQLPDLVAEFQKTALRPNGAEGRGATQNSLFAANAGRAAVSGGSSGVVTPFIAR